MMTYWPQMKTCVHALLTDDSKHVTIISQTSAFLVFSGSCLRNIHPSGISVVGSVTSTPSVVRCWCRYTQLGSCINFMMTSMSASDIWCQYFTINFFSDVMVDLNASFQSSTRRSLNVIMISSILLWYICASARFWGPESGKSSGSMSGTSITSMGASLDAILSSYWNLPKEGATPGLPLPKQGKLWCFWCKTSAYIVFMTLI